MAAKSEKKAGSHKPGHLEVSATVTGSDGATYTVCGCSVEEVQAAVESLRGNPAVSDLEPHDIKAEG